MISCVLMFVFIASMLVRERERREDCFEYIWFGLLRCHHSGGGVVGLRVFVLSHVDSMCRFALSHSFSGVTRSEEDGDRRGSAATAGRSGKAAG